MAVTSGPEYFIRTNGLSCHPSWEVALSSLSIQRGNHKSGVVKQLRGDLNSVLSDLWNAL